jgi:hypothetical protein
MQASHPHIPTGLSSAVAYLTPATVVGRLARAGARLSPRRRRERAALLSQVREDAIELGIKWCVAAQRRHGSSPRDMSDDALRTLAAEMTAALSAADTQAA